MNNITKTLLISVFMLVLAVQTSVASPLVCGDVGDVNGDKNITISDASMLLGGVMVTNGNVTGDNVTDVADVIEILQYVSGKRSTFTGCGIKSYFTDTKSVVKVESDKTLSINGKKVFPQVFYTICYDTTIADCNKNLERMSIYTSDISGGGHAQLQTLVASHEAAKVGFTATADTTAPSMFSNSPVFFGYLQRDEPNNNPSQVPGLITNYNAIKALDQNHIVLTTDWRYLKELTGTADVLMTDFYPKRAGWSLTAMGSFDNLPYFYEHILSRDVYQGTPDEINRPVWNIIQANANVDDGGNLPLTQKEIRNMVYNSITMNTKGLAYYTYAWSPKQDSALVNNQEMTQDYINIAKEINSLNDVLVLPSKDYSWQFRKGTMVSFSNNPSRWNGFQQLNYMLKQDGNSYYLIVVNKDVTAITTDIGIVGLSGVVTEIGMPEAGSVPGRTINVVGEKFTDTFDGQAVKIYKIT